MSGHEFSWAMETMRMINKMTPDIQGKAFDPDWFLLRNRLEEFERAHVASVAHAAQQLEPKPLRYVETQGTDNWKIVSGHAAQDFVASVAQAAPQEQVHFCHDNVCTDRPLRKHPCHAESCPERLDASYAVAHPNLAPVTREWVVATERQLDADTTAQPQEVPAEQRDYQTIADNLLNSPLRENREWLAGWLCNFDAGDFQLAQPASAAKPAEQSAPCGNRFWALGNRKLGIADGYMEPPCELKLGHEGRHRAKDLSWGPDAQPASAAKPPADSPMTLLVNALHDPRWQDESSRVAREIADKARAEVDRCSRNPQSPTAAKPAEDGLEAQLMEILYMDANREAQARNLTVFIRTHTGADSKLNDPHMGTTAAKPAEDGLEAKLSEVIAAHMFLVGEEWNDCECKCGLDFPVGYDAAGKVSVYPKDYWISHITPLLIKAIRTHQAAREGLHEWISTDHVRLRGENMKLEARERLLLERCELAEGVAKKQSHSIAKLDNQLQSLLEKLEGLAAKWDMPMAPIGSALSSPCARELRALIAKQKEGK